MPTLRRGVIRDALLGVPLDFVALVIFVHFVSFVVAFSPTVRLRRTEQRIDSSEAHAAIGI